VLWSKKGSELTATAWDVATDSVICTFGPTKDNILVELKRWYPQSDGSMLKLVAAWDVPCPLPDLECDRILNLHHFSGSSMTCLVLEGGDIIVVREYPHDGEQEIEIMGSVDVGITAASWSPDEELLAVTTRADTLLYMTREFESVTDAVLLPDDLDASKHVSVGWGKSETQFKGRGAKALRDPTMPEKIDQGIQSPQDDGTTTISWRGDGAYVAVNSRQASHRRVIRVYSREGLLDGVSEPVDAMEQALSWRPAGNLLAAVQRLEDRIEIVFVERNGLRHGQFVLRLSKADMETWGAAIDLKWNADSSILAVCFIDRVQLWTMGNYHYYLKQEIRLPSRSTTKRPALFSWHPEQPLLCDMGSEG
jgi:elongator complex protein 1